MRSLARGRARSRGLPGHGPSPTIIGGQSTAATRCRRLRRSADDPARVVASHHAVATASVMSIPFRFVAYERAIATETMAANARLVGPRGSEATLLPATCARTPSASMSATERTGPPFAQASPSTPGAANPPVSPGKSRS